MTVDTELPVREAPHQGATDATEAAELLRTMAAVVRTVFGVALQAPAEAPVEQQAVAQVEAPAAPVAVALPVEAPILVAVPEAPASIQLTMPPVEPIPAEPVGLTIVPDPEAAVATESAPPAASLPMPSISLDEGSWTPPQQPDASTPPLVIPADSPPEVPAVRAAPASIPVPTYVAPVVARPVEPVADRHSLALLQEIAFLDD